MLKSSFKELKVKTVLKAKKHIECSEQLFYIVVGATAWESDL